MVTLDLPGTAMPACLSHLCPENLTWQPSGWGPPNMARQKWGSLLICGSGPTDGCQLSGELSESFFCYLWEWLWILGGWCLLHPCGVSVRHRLLPDFQCFSFGETNSALSLSCPNPGGLFPCFWATTPNPENHAPRLCTKQETQARVTRIKPLCGLQSLTFHWSPWLSLFLS